MSQSVHLLNTTLDDFRYQPGIQNISMKSRLLLFNPQAFASTLQLLAKWVAGNSSTFVFKNFATFYGQQNEPVQWLNTILKAFSFEVTLHNNQSMYDSISNGLLLRPS